MVVYLSNLVSEKGETDVLVGNLKIIFISNALLPPTLELFNPMYFMLLIKRKFFTKGKTQRELNLIYENPPMNISFSYSHIFQTILTTVFFSALFTPGAIINFFGIVYLYIVDKVI